MTIHTELTDLDVIAAVLQLHLGEAVPVRVGLFDPDRAPVADLLAAQGRWSDHLAALASSVPSPVQIHQGSVAAADLLGHLQQWRQQLAKGGCLLWCGELQLQAQERARTWVPPLQTFQRLSQRLGFSIIQQQDHGTAVAPGWGAVAQLLDRHADVLSTDLAVSTEALADLRDRLQATQGRLLQGELGYFSVLLRFDPEAAGADVSFADIHGFDPADIAPVFEASFGHTFQPAVWHWKYRGGRGRAIVARRNGRLLAHYGGAPRDILYFGEPDQALQICDVMVLPEARSHYAVGGLFQMTAATLLEREIGWTAEHLLGFGFPNLKAMHIATRLGLYARTDDFLEVLFTGDMARPPEWQALPLAISDALADADALWVRMAQGFREGIIGLRDAAYIDYRYRRHPVGDYRLLRVSDPDGACRGLALFKPHADGWLLMDVVADVADLAPVIRQAVTDWQRRQGGAPVRFWVTRGGLTRLAQPDWEGRALGIEIPCHTWSPGPDPQRLQERWWLTAGDMDFQ